MLNLKNTTKVALVIAALIIGYQEYVTTSPVHASAEARQANAEFYAQFRR